MTHLNDISKVYLEQIAESCVPGKPAEKVGALTNIDIPQNERDAARARLLAKTKAKREKVKEEVVDEAKKAKRWWDDDGDGIGYEKGEVSGKFKKKKNVKEAAHASKSEMHSPHEVPSKNLKQHTDENDKAKGELGEFIPGVGNKRLYSTTKTTTAKESFSNWRQDLSEVMSDDID